MIRVITRGMTMGRKEMAERPSALAHPSMFRVLPLKVTLRIYDKSCNKARRALRTPAHWIVQ